MKTSPVNTIHPIQPKTGLSYKYDGHGKWEAWLDTSAFIGQLDIVVMDDGTFGVECLFGADVTKKTFRHLGYAQEYCDGYADLLRDGLTKEQAFKRMEETIHTPEWQFKRA